MQENWQRLKILPAWKPDEWICHHSGNRSSTMRDDYFRYGSNSKSAPTTPKRISTAKLRRQIENLSLKSANYRLSSNQSKTKRLTSTLSRKSYKSIFSAISRRSMTPIHIPKMSKKSLKRWLDARDAYLGHNYPYVLERFEHHHHRRRHRQRTKSAKEKDGMIDDESAISILSMETDRHTIAGVTSSGQQRRFSRKDSCGKRLSQSETNLRQNRSFFDRLKSFVQAPVRSLSRLSLRKPPLLSRPQKRVQIIHDHFDDKCVGTETMEQCHYRTDIQHHDQCIQVNIPRPKIHLHHEFDTSMVVGEKKQRIRSARRDVDYNDKATETDFILKFVNVEKEKREEKKLIDDDNDKTTRHNIKNEKINSYPSQSNVQQEQSQFLSMSTKNNQPKKKTNQSEQLANTGNRIVPLTDLTGETRSHNDPNGSRTTILTSTDSNLSTNEQLRSTSPCQ